MYTNPYEGVAIISALKEFLKNQSEGSGHRKLDADLQPYCTEIIGIGFSRWLGRILLSVAERMIRQAH